MSGYRARIRCSMSLSTRRSCACRWTSSATSFGWLDRAIAGAATAFFGAPNGSASRGVMGQKRLARALRREQTSGNGARDGEHLQFRAGCGTRAVGVTVPFVDFTAHQAPMALQRLKDQGGFNGDRIESCAMPTVFASGSDWLRTVIDKSDLAEGNLAGTRIRETTFAHTALRKARLRSARLERVELYFCDLNEIDAAQISARRLKIHGCEAMNAVFSGAQLAVARFEDTKLYRARFDGALIVRTVFSDARLIDVSMRGANLMGASFARATLIGVDLRDAALTGADFSGATTIGCNLPAESGA